MSGDKLEVPGVVQRVASGDLHIIEVELPGGAKRTVIARRSGHLNRHRIRCIPGDPVIVELSAYSLDRGRIIHRGERAA